MCALRGIKLTNRVWSWCGRKVDGALVIFTLWQDCFVKIDGKFRYPLTHKEDRSTNDNPDRPGWREMVGVANFCLDNPSTRVLGVMCKAVDVDADPRKREWIDDKEFKVLRVERGDDGEAWATIVGTERA